MAGLHVGLKLMNIIEYNIVTVWLTTINAAVTTNASLIVLSVKSLADEAVPTPNCITAVTPPNQE